MDQARFARARARHRHSLSVEPGVSPNLRFARLFFEPGAQLEIARGFATERQEGNQIRLGAGAHVRLERDVWLRTECGPNRITAFPGATIRVGARSLVNGAMLHAKRSIEIGEDASIGFGVRILDADLHDLDRSHPEQVDPVTLGDRVWVGADALILRGVHIGDDVVVGARSVVTHDLPARVLALGVPAQPVREIESRVGCR
ncbi:MAG: acyltransferase [Myxococcota bacterium]